MSESIIHQPEYTIENPILVKDLFKPNSGKLYETIDYKYTQKGLVQIASFPQPVVETNGVYKFSTPDFSTNLTNELSVRLSDSILLQQILNGGDHSNFDVMLASAVKRDLMDAMSKVRGIQYEFFNAVFIIQHKNIPNPKIVLVGNQISAYLSNDDDSSFIKPHMFKSDHEIVPIQMFSPEKGEGIIIGTGLHANGIERLQRGIEIQKQLTYSSFGIPSSPTLHTAHYIGPITSREQVNS